MHKHLLAIAITLTTSVAVAADAAPPDFSEHVAPMLRKYCVGCHSADEAEGKLVLDSFDAIGKGGEHGPILVPGKADESRVVLMLEKKVEPFMPPEGSEAPTAEEVALLKAWIAAGAKGPKTDSPQAMTLNVPFVEPTGTVSEPIGALTYAPDGRSIAAGRYSVVEILDAIDQPPLKVLPAGAGQVNAVVYSRDGSRLAAAGGQPGLAGEITVWDTATWKPVLAFQGHRDAIYAAEISPDGTLLATGGYDHEIHLWDLKTGTNVRTLKGHNGPVFDVAFHPAGRILASASDDRTIKLWNVATGERLDTFIEPTKAQYSVAFSPDGRIVAAGGVDNRIRVWELLQGGKEGTSPLRSANFAHESAILSLCFSPDGKLLASSAEDRTLKVWETTSFTQVQAFENWSDWVTAFSISPNSDALIVGVGGELLSLPLNDPIHGAVPKQSQQTPQTTITSTPAEPTAAAESEPNDDIGSATSLQVPAIAKGALHASQGPSADADVYRFSAKAGEKWVVETRAEADKSPADTKIEVLNADGSPVLRLQLRAIRDSNITFRPIDSNQTEARLTNWEEMKLNQFVYLSGEVCRLLRAPRGPDSGFQFFTSNGRRRCYFDTSGVTHANEEAVYIVEPFLPEAEFPDNGLPVFPLYYTNDDDGERKLGKDSRLYFTAPADGDYLVRVTEVRGFGGEDYKYSLAIRRPQPGFSVSIEGRDAKIGAGSGQRFRVNLNRIDEFDGPVRVDIQNIPAGYVVSTPIIIEAGHDSAEGALHADAGAQQLDEAAWKNVSVTATSTVSGNEVTQNVGDLGKVTLEAKPNVVAFLEVDRTSTGSSNDEGDLTIQPGTSTTAMLRIERNGFQGELRFDVDNLPYGVIVDDIGLSGILVRDGESERRIFLKAADWVPASTRWIHAVSQGAGNQASLPIRLHVKPAAELATTASSASP